MEIFGGYDTLVSVTYFHKSLYGTQARKRETMMSLSGQSSQIADTSALVLLWCGSEIYDSSAVRRYARMLDLSRGEALFGICNAIWPDYASVIRLRKLCIAQEAKSVLFHGNIRQVIIPGAGFSMLGVELAELFPDVRVFELDTSQMPEKQSLVNRVFGSRNPAIHCIASDVNDGEQSTRRLVAAGWKSHEPSLMILEGLSYYLSKAAARRQWQPLVDGSKIIFEYLVPYEQVSARRRMIPKAVFEAIMNYCSSNPEVAHWSEQELRQEEGVRLDFCYALSDIERSSRAERRFFAERRDGWIEIAGLTRCASAEVPCPRQ